MLNKVVLTNFMNIEFTEINGVEGINAYIGNNGQGKSAVFEAIAFVFLDRKKGGTFKDYIKIGEASARVQIEWLIGQESCFFDYEIANTGTVARSIQFAGIKYVGTEECRKFLEEHFDLKMLKDIVFNLQDSEAITQMPPADRREILQKVFNVDFRQGLVKLKNDMDAKKEQMNLVIARKTALSEKQYPFMRVEIIQDEDKLPEYKQEKAELSLKIQQAGDLSEINAKISGQNSVLSQLSSQIILLSGNIVSYEQQITQLESSILEKQESKKADTSGLENLKAEIVTLEQNRDKIPVTPPDKVTELEKKLADDTGELSLYKKQLEMNLKGKCESCGQDCTPEHIEELQNKVTICTQTVETERKELEIIKNDIASRKQIEDSISNNRAMQNVISERLAGVDAIIKTQSENKERTQATLNTFRTQKTEAETKKSEAQAVLATYNTELEQKTKELEELNPSKQRVLELSELVSTIENAQTANAERVKMNEQLEAQRVLDIKEIEKLTISEQAFIHEIDILKETKKILETILPDFIISQGCLILKNFINDFILSTGADLTVNLIATSSGKRSKGVQFFYRSHIQGATVTEWLPVTMASGYETALLTLAFKLAIAYMYQSDILLLDEPDKTATEENSLLLFKHIANLEGFRQIFLISHREPLKEWIRNEADAMVYSVYQGIFEEVFV